ncbi:MAG: hypothetical protein AAGN82_22560, partial [Myxococcota bacterium]
MSLSSRRGRRRRPAFRTFAAGGLVMGAALAVASSGHAQTAPPEEAPDPAPPVAPPKDGTKPPPERPRPPGVMP